MLTESKSYKVNVGCGPTGQIEGFINLDNSPSIIIAKIPILKWLLLKFGILTKGQYNSKWSNVFRYDVTRGLPFENQTVIKIYTSHFIEHIPQKKGVKFFKECQRVLQPNGVIRIVVPDLLTYAENYVKETKKLLAKSPFSKDRSIHDNFLITIYGAYLKRKRFGAEHCYMYDLPTLMSILSYIGFRNIKEFSYQVGDDDELSFYDSRKSNSLYIEAQK